jgi:hypothetical protein
VVKTLSGANLTNIAAAFLDPDILVEMPNLSKQWSTKTRTSYETRIVAISPLRQAIDPRGGVAEQSDFSVTIQQETPTQFIQDQNVDHESVNVYLQFGTDAKITLIKGKLDRWEYAGGLLTLHCIANTNLLGKQLPTQEVTAEAFPTYEVPVASIGTMVPLTLGQVDRARLVLIDESWGAQKLKVNAELTGHAGVGAFTDAEVWMDSSKDFIEITDTLAGQTAGHVLKSDGGRWGRWPTTPTLTFRGRGSSIPVGHGTRTSVHSPVLIRSAQMTLPPTPM